MTDWGMVAIGKSLEAVAHLCAESASLRGSLQVIDAICRDEPDREKALAAIARIAASATSTGADERLTHGSR